MTEEQERAYDMIDRQLRNSLHSDEDYAEYSAALEVVLSAALSQPTSEPVAWRCRSWGADEWAYFDHDDKPASASPEQMKPLYDSQPASDEAANIMELAHCFMVKPEGPSNYDQVEARLKAYVNRVDASPAPEAMARRFHEAYERLAPTFGYETRAETRDFNPQSPNGKLMIAVCASIAQPAVPEAPPERLMNLNRASPAAPNEGLSHLNANGAEAWKDVPRAGDWVADAGEVK